MGGGTWAPGISSPWRGPRPSILTHGEGLEGMSGYGVGIPSQLQPWEAAVCSPQCVSGYISGRGEGACFTHRGWSWDPCAAWGLVERVPDATPSSAQEAMQVRGQEWEVGGRRSMLPRKRSDLSRGPWAPESLPLRVLREGTVDAAHLVPELCLGECRAQAVEVCGLNVGCIVQRASGGWGGCHCFQQFLLGLQCGVCAGHWN